jgi:glycosyltransferase involved in cell wall biosynthesis
MTKDFRDSIEKLDYIIAPSQYMQNILSNELKEISPRVVNIPNFVPQPPDRVRKSEFDDYFLYVGVIEEHKGIETLMNTFSNEDISEKLLIVGTGSLEKSINRRIKEDGLEDKIFTLGWKDKVDLWPLYKDSVAVILPSVCDENAPLVALEALSIGVPLISSDCGGLPEIVGKLDGDLIFSDNKLGEVIANFNRDKYHPDLIQEIYSKNYSPESFMQGYEALTKEVRGG